MFFPWDISRLTDPSGPNELLPGKDKLTWLYARDGQLHLWPQSQESSLPWKIDSEQMGLSQDYPELGVFSVSS